MNYYNGIYKKCVPLIKDSKMIKTCSNHHKLKQLEFKNCLNSKYSEFKFFELKKFWNQNSFNSKRSEFKMDQNSKIIWSKPTYFLPLLSRRHSIAFAI